MKYFAVQYLYPNEDPAVVALRPEHREWLAGLGAADQLVGSGPFIDGQGDALIIIRLPDTATLRDAEELMDQDPFNRDQVLAGRHIREWNPVLNVFRSPDED